MKQKEIWKNIDDIYSVSNQGRIKSNDMVANAKNGSIQIRKGRILKLKIENNGYIRVMLKDRKTYYIHRLVAKYFLENPQKKPQINHKDSNPANNKVKNLEWTTQKENIQYGWKYGNCSYDKIGRKLTLRQAQEIRNNYCAYDKKYGLKAFAERFNISKTQIWKILRGYTYELDATN